MNEVSTDPDHQCPCGTGRDYDQCCGPLIEGHRPATTAEALMRSRYTAYTIAAIDYVLATVSRKQQQFQDERSSREWAEQSDWQKLEVIETSGGGEEDSLGEVEFIAHYSMDGVDHQHRERAQFRREDTLWRYYGGKEHSPVTTVVTPPKIGRNEQCPCGSGKKYKKCCGP